MFTQGLFIAALAALTANAATVKQMMVEQPNTNYVQTETTVGCSTETDSCDDDSYCFRNTGCISTQWDQQI